MEAFKKILVSGGAGFIGSNFIHYMHARHGDCRIVVLDALTYAGNLANLAGPLQESNFDFVKGDICDAEVVEKIFATGIDAGDDNVKLIKNGNIYKIISI